MRRRFAFFALAVGFCLRPALAETIILIRAAPDDDAALACRQALHDDAPRLGLPDLVLRDSGPFSVENKTPPEVTYEIHLSAPLLGDSIELAAAPFAFRDPAHFQAFRDSEVYRKLRAADRGQQLPRAWLTVAYGGFNQLFSAKRAMTEPKHFYARHVGGSANAFLFSAFSAIDSPLTILYPPSPGQASDDDIEAMRKSENAMAAVDAPLLAASRYGLAQAAKFVDLTFTSVYPVVFYFKQNQFNGGNDHPVATAVRARLTRWAEAAAQSCSAANLRHESEQLDALKTAGLTVVPTDRAAFVRAGWIHALQFDQGWTLDEFDELVRLGATGRVDLPSTALAAAPAKIRAAFLAVNQKAEAEQRASLASVEQQERIEAAVGVAVADMAAALRAVAPPADGLAPRAERLLDPGREMRSPDIGAAQRERERAEAFLSGTGPDPCAPESICRESRSWREAARTLQTAGDLPGARVLLEAAARLAEPKLGPTFAKSRRSDFNERLETLKAQANLLGPADLRPVLDAARKTMTAPPLSDTYPYAIGLREDRVEFLSYLALFYDKIGAAKIGDSAISEAAGLAVATGEGSLARVASIEWTRGHAAAAWELGAQALELASSPNDVDNALDAFSAMRPVVGEKAAVFKQSIAGINAHGN